MNKIKAIIVFALFFAEILVLLPEQTTGITAHATIYIDGNADFANKALAEGWQGDGSGGNPYVIEGYDINASSANGIEIRNTNVYFIIRNCTVRDGRSKNNDGIYLYNVTNCKIQNVSCYNNYDGFELDYSSNNNITSNRIYNNSWSGISLYSFSNNNVMSENRIYNNYWACIYLCFSSSNNLISANWICSSFNGIVLEKYSSNNLISTNWIYSCLHGIFLLESPNNNVISANQIYNNGYGIYPTAASNNNSISTNQIYSNYWAGIFLYHFPKNNMISTNQIYNNPIGIEVYHSSMTNTIDTNQIYNNGYGIYLETSSETGINENQIYNNSHGIYFYSHYLFESSSNCITANRIYNNIDGIYFCSHSNNNLITTNQIYNNSDGLHISSASYNNLITANWIYNHSNYGIHIGGEDNKLTNISSYNNMHGIYIDGSDNNIANSSFYNNSNYGIYVGGDNNKLTNISSYNNMHGMYIYSSGSNSIANSSFYNNSNYGVYIGNYSYSNKLANISAYNNMHGIYIDNSNNNNMADCSIYNNSNYGIYIGGIHSYKNKLTNIYSYNNMHGIYIYNSSINNVANSSFYNNYYGIRLEQSSYNDLTNSNFYNNMFGIYLKQVTENNITNISLTKNSVGIHLSYSSSNNISNLTSYNNTYGIYFAYSSNKNDITESSFYDNSAIGIYLSGSSENSITNISIYNNSIGMALSTSSDDNEIKNNSFQSNFNYGVYISYSNSNLIYYNSFIDNKNQAYDDSSNYWDNGTIGNYWSDYIGYDADWDGIGDIPYNISGGENKDMYPLIYPLQAPTTDTPPEITITGVVDGGCYNTTVIPVINIRDYNLDKNTVKIKLNQIEFRSGTEVGEEGSYVLIVYAADKLGNSNVKIISFSIDKVEPNINIVNVEDGAYYNFSIVPIIEITDENLNLTNITLNGINFNSGTAIVEEGDYVLIVEANDKAGNKVQKKIEFVVDKTAPIINITYVEDGILYNRDVGPVIEIFDANLDKYLIKLNRKKFISGEAITEDGKYVLSVEAKDKAGNIFKKTITFSIDKTKPENVFVNVERIEDLIILRWNPSTDENFNRYEVWQATKKDFSDGVCIGDITDRDTTTYTITGLLAGKSYYFKVKVIDNAGNEGSSEQVSITLKKETKEKPWLLIGTAIITIVVIVSLVITKKLKK